jgi:hypothetical protein
MSSNGGASTSQHVMSVLQTLYVDPDPIAKKRAGEWLEEFQHSVSLASRCESTEAPLFEIGGADE